MTDERLETVQSSYSVVPSMELQTPPAIRHSLRLFSDIDRVPKYSLLTPLEVSFLTAVRPEARWQMITGLIFKLNSSTSY